MPVISSLFGGSCRDDLISFSSLNTWDALDGLFPTSRRGPVQEMRVPPMYPYGTRVKCRETGARRTHRADLHGLGIDGVKLGAHGEGFLRACATQSPKGKEQRPSSGGERSLDGFCRRIQLPDDDEAELMRAAIRKGILMISTPRKGREKELDSPIGEASAERSGKA